MTRYVLANVEIPIQVNENGDIETLQSYAKVNIIKEIDAPELNDTEHLSIDLQIKELFKSQLPDNKEDNNVYNKDINSLNVEEDDVMVLKKEIKEKSYNILKNATFKNHRCKGYRHNTTAKKIN